MYQVKFTTAYKKAYSKNKAWATGTTNKIVKKLSFLKKFT